MSRTTDRAGTKSRKYKGAPNNIHTKHKIRVSDPPDFTGICLISGYDLFIANKYGENNRTMERKEA